MDEMEENDERMEENGRGWRWMGEGGEGRKELESVEERMDGRRRRRNGWMEGIIGRCMRRW